MTLQRRWILSLVTVVSVIAAGPAAPLAQQPPPIPATGSIDGDTAGFAVADLAGLWEGTFTLDSAWSLPQSASARTIRARIQFSSAGTAAAPVASSRSVHGGTFDIDFTRFGFRLSTQEALGWSTSPDSLRGVLNPTVDHGHVELHGQISGDAVAVGTWRFVSDPGGARGTFRLQRARTR